LVLHLLLLLGRCRQCEVFFTKLLQQQRGRCRGQCLQQPMLAAASLAMMLWWQSPPGTAAAAA
jgi:hypothetical protein